MGDRLQLQALLVSILGDKNVYLQAPQNVQMQYPAILYKLEKVDTTHADNVPYRHDRRYEVTLIDYDPESPFVDKILALPKCEYDRSFPSDDLNHTVFTLYF